MAYTNAATIVSDEFQDTDDLDGLFSGFDPETRTYDTAQLAVRRAGGRGQREQGGPARRRETASGHAARVARHRACRAHPQRDETLQHPNCVYQILKRHFSRYTPEMVARTCGVSEEAFLEVCEAWTQNSGRERTTALVYSVGWTQHSVGVQYIRTGAILQLLLGNMGRPGGGIMALRGHASIQGSTDIPTLFNLLPGYLPMPNAADHQTLRAVGRQHPAPGLQGVLGQRGRLRGQPAQGLLGRRGHGRERLLLRLPAEDHRRPRHLPHRARHDRRQGQGLLPARPEPRRRARPTARRSGSAWPTSTGWSSATCSRSRARPSGRTRPEIETGEIVPEECRTEVFLLPAASHVEKEGHLHPDAADAAVAGEGARAGRATAAPSCGSSTTSAGWSGSGWRAPPSPRTARCSTSPGTTRCTGEYDEPSAEAVLREINGYEVATAPAAVDVHRDEGRRLDRRRLLDLHRRLRGRRQPGGPAQARQRAVLGGPRVGLGVAAEPAHPLQPRLGRPRRQAVERAKAYVWWDEEAGEWTGHDVPDFEKTKPPSYRPPEGSDGVEALAGDDPFIMQGDGKGSLYVPAGPDRRPDAHPLRAGRVAVPQPALRPAGQPDAQGVRRARTTGSTPARPRSTATSSRSCSPRAG